MNQKQLMRAVVRQVHPDLFTNHPYERARNTESLKVLNNYADLLAKGDQPQRARVEFYIKDAASTLIKVSAELPSRGSLAPLFLAFGLVSPEEAAADIDHAGSTAPEDRDLFEWLSQTAAEAARAADQHDALKRIVRELRSDIEDEFGLESIDLGGEYAVGMEDQQQQVEALQTLQAGLQYLPWSKAAAYEDLRLRVYHTQNAPLTTIAFQDGEGVFNIQTVPMTTHVADDGTVHVLADPVKIATELAEVDLNRAHLLCKVSSYWNRRARDLCGALCSFLGVDNIWFDSRGNGSAQRFVLWAGTVLEMGDQASELLAQRKFSFSLLVHFDPSGPLLDFIPSSSVLQVRCDCPAKHLLGFMTSQAGALAHKVAAQVADSRLEEEELLAEVRAALGAKHVIRVCSSYDQGKVMEAAQRLIEAAPSLRAAVDLTGVSLAIDDCYELWESGFVSIPYDFALSDLQPKLKALLTSGEPQPSRSNNGPSVNGWPQPMDAAEPAVSNARGTRAMASRQTGGIGSRGNLSSCFGLVLPKSTRLGLCRSTNMARVSRGMLHRGIQNNKQLSRF